MPYMPYVLYEHSDKSPRIEKYKIENIKYKCK